MSRYAVDLLNGVGGDRTDAGQPQCKVGQLCNGRCIPKGASCGGKKLSSAVGKAMASSASGLANAGVVGGAGYLAYKNRAAIKEAGSKTVEVKSPERVEANGARNLASGSGGGINPARLAGKVLLRAAAPVAVAGGIHYLSSKNLKKGTVTSKKQYEETSKAQMESDDRLIAQAEARKRARANR
jgi:hypothetical protein